MTGLWWWRHQCFSSNSLDQCEIFPSTSPAGSPSCICEKRYISHKTPRSSPAPCTSKTFLSSFNQHSHTLLYFPSGPTWNEQLQAKLFLLCSNESSEMSDMIGNTFGQETHMWIPITATDLADARTVQFIMHLKAPLCLSCDHTSSTAEWCHPLFFKTDKKGFTCKVTTLL